MTKNFASLATNLGGLHNYFDRSINLSDLYPAKLLNLSAKPFSFRVTEFVFRNNKCTRYR